MDASADALAPLRRDFCCRKNMLWATSLSTEFASEPFIEALERRGFRSVQDGPRIGGLAIFEHGETGHRVVYVARTGRMQIRLDPLTSHDDRAAAAEYLYEQLRGASHDLTPSSGLVETASGI